MRTYTPIKNTAELLLCSAESQAPPAHSVLKLIHLWISYKAQTVLLHNKYLPILSVLRIHWAICLLHSMNSRKASERLLSTINQYKTLLKHKQKKENTKKVMAIVSSPPAGLGDFSTSHDTLILRVARFALLYLPLQPTPTLCWLHTPLAPLLSPHTSTGTQQNEWQQSQTVTREMLNRYKVSYNGALEEVAQRNWIFHSWNNFRSKWDKLACSLT